jgi:hypothetical protein
MANYCILRVEKRKTIGAKALARHAHRESKVQNADPSRAGENTVMAGPTTAEAVMELHRSKLPAKHRKDAVTALDFFVGMSPEAAAAMTPTAQDQYFKRALRWIAAKFGGSSNIISAVVHRDETTAHMQVLTVPLLNGTLNAKQLVGNRGDMQAMQDSFAETVGAASKLRRGERGSPAKHTSIRQFYGAIRAAGATDALPPRVEVPDVPPKPSMFSSSSARKEHAEAEAKRKRALQANAKRQAEIERLARVGLAVHGRGRRALPDVATATAKMNEEAERSKRVVAKGREVYTSTAKQTAELEAKKAKLERDVRRLQRQAETLRSDLDQDDGKSTPKG